MGANKTYQQKGDRGRMLGESDEFRRLRHAVEKAAGDRDRAIRLSAACTHEREDDCGRRAKLAEYDKPIRPDILVHGVRLNIALVEGFIEIRSDSLI